MKRVRYIGFNSNKIRMNEKYRNKKQDESKCVKRTTPTQHVRLQNGSKIIMHSKHTLFFSILLHPALYFGAHCRKFEEKPKCIHEKTMRRE